MGKKTERKVKWKVGKKTERKVKWKVGKKTDRKVKWKVGKKTERKVKNYCLNGFIRVNFWIRKSKQEELP